MHTLICVTFSLPPGISGWLRLLLVALPGLFCLPLCIHMRNPFDSGFLENYILGLPLFCASRVLPITCFSKLLAFSDTGEVEYRNAQSVALNLL